MRHLAPCLLNLLLLLGTISACRRDATPPKGERPGETASASTQSQKPTALALAQGERASSATPLAPPTPAAEKLPTPEERQACLGPPLSPSPEELPEVEGLRHRADGHAAPEWLVTVFRHLRMPPPEVRPYQAVRVQGTLRVEERDVQR